MSEPWDHAFAGGEDGWSVDSFPQ